MKKVFLSLLSFILLFGSNYAVPNVFAYSEKGLSSIVSSDLIAYVNVKGYYRKDGTYVKPHVRSNPNGLKYDNYGYKPSQGLYNPSYGTKGADWDTPTWSTDPDYYKGKALYESRQTGTTNTITTTPINQNTSKTLTVPANAYFSTYTNTWFCNTGYRLNQARTACDKIEVPANATLNYLGTGWYCNFGYTLNSTKTGCLSIQVPENASLNYLGNGWSCNVGYKLNVYRNGCEQVSIPANARLNYLGNGWECNIGYRLNTARTGCVSVQIPTNARLNYLGNGWECNVGYRMNYTRTGCEKVEVPTNASLNYLGNGWDCNDGFKRVGNTCEKYECGSNEYQAYGMCVCQLGYWKIYSTNGCEPLNYNY